MQAMRERVSVPLSLPGPLNTLRRLLADVKQAEMDLFKARTRARPMCAFYHYSIALILLTALVGAGGAGMAETLGDITIDTDTTWPEGTYEIHNLTITDGAVLSVAGGSTLALSGDLVLTKESTLLLQGKNSSGQVDGEWLGVGVGINAGNVRIDAGSTISASGQAYIGTAGPGAGGSDLAGAGASAGAGGGHGGAGGGGGGRVAVEYAHGAAFGGFSASTASGGSGYADGAAGTVVFTDTVRDGDCNGNAAVTVNELILDVRIALGESTPTACPAIDSDGSRAVTVDDLLRAVNRALSGC